LQLRLRMCRRVLAAVEAVQHSEQQVRGARPPDGARGNSAR
jgi:hypothetical protein